MKLSFADVLDDGFSLEEVNRSHRSSYREYFTPELERLIYCKYRWLFDKGFYPREVFSRSVVPSIPALEQGPR